MDAFEQTKVMLTTVSFEEARQAMQEGKVYGIFYIPKDFGVDATAGRQPKLSFYTNGTYLIAASLLFRDMKTMSVLAGASVGLPDHGAAPADRDRYTRDRESLA